MSFKMGILLARVPTLILNLLFPMLIGTEAGFSIIYIITTFFDKGSLILAMSSVPRLYGNRCGGLVSGVVLFGFIFGIELNIGVVAILSSLGLSIDTLLWGMNVFPIASVLLILVFENKVIIEDVENDEGEIYSKIVEQDV